MEESAPPNPEAPRSTTEQSTTAILAESPEATMAPDSPESQVRQRHVGRRLGLGALLKGLASGFALVLAGTVATAAGIVLAEFFPAPRSNASPLLETALETGAGGLRTLRRLPIQGARALLNGLEPPPQPQLAPAAPLLSDLRREQMAGEVAALQTELTQVTLRTAALEQQLGYQYAGAEPNQRLTTLAQTLANPGIGPKASGQPEPNPRPLTVTLPLDPLFEDNQSLLKPGSTALLGALLSNLRSYPAAIVTVGVHTDDVGPAATRRELSLRRAQIIVDYLKLQGGSDRLIWNPVGYGDADPLVPNDGNENRQRNRRLEIRVTPK